MRLQDLCIARSANMRLVSESNDNLIGYIASTIETMRDEMATKQDLARMGGQLSERLEASTTAIRGDLEQVQLRLDTMEHGISSRFEHVEGELSRLRSAV